MAYAPSPVPTDLPGLVRYVRQELERIAAEFRGSSVTLPELHAAPPKPRDGMVCFFDGTDFNPGSGRGYYGYRGGWHFLG